MDHSIEAEQNLLGAILVNNEAFGRVSDILQVKHFFEPIHRAIYEIIAQLASSGRLASAVTIQTFLPKDVTIGTMTAREYCARLAAEAVTIINAPDFARLIRDHSDHRDLDNLAREVLEHGHASDPADRAAWIIDQADTVVAERSLGQVPSLTLRASVVRAVDAAAKAYQNDGALTGMPCGLRDLDRKTSGIHKAELTILAGRPGQGKTLLAQNFSRAMCSAGHKGIFFSLEMGDTSLSRRFMSDILFDRYELAHFRIRSGNFNEQDFARIRDAALALADLPLRIEQQAGLTLSQIAARARQARRREKLDFIVVDHMGHVQASDRYRGNKVNEIGEVSSGLLRLAKELDIAVIALSQLSRGVEGRDNKRPTVSDLRDSGNLEQDAATVLMVYREAYYLSNAEPRVGTPEYEKWQTDMARCLNDLEIIVAKQRDGSTGTVRAFVNVACNAARNEGWVRGAEEFHEHMPTENFAF